MYFFNSPAKAVLLLTLFFSAALGLWAEPVSPTPSPTPDSTPVASGTPAVASTPVEATSPVAATPAPDQSPIPDISPAPGSLSVEGLIIPQQVISLAAPSEGLITNITVTEGSIVAEGQNLAQLADDEEKIQYRNAEFQASKLQDILNSLERLYNEKVTSRLEYNKALLSLEQAISERDVLAIRVKKMTINAPCSSYVMRLLKHTGESVQRLEKFAELVVTGHVYLAAYVDASYLGKIPVGSKAIIYPGNGAKPVEGIVEVSDPILDNGGKVFRVKIRIDTPGPNLIPGMRARVELYPKG